MASIEKSTITIPKALVIGFALFQSALTFFTSYYGNQAAQDLKNEQLSNKIDIVEMGYQKQDALFELRLSQARADVDQNRRGIEAISTYLSAGMRPEDIKTKRYR